MKPRIVYILFIALGIASPTLAADTLMQAAQAVAVMGKSQLGANLSGDEIDLIVSFLDGLTGQQPSVIYPTLPPNVTSSPHPDK
jgi:cytochrome c peroxidase